LVWIYTNKNKNKRIRRLNIQTFFSEILKNSKAKIKNHYNTVPIGGQNIGSPKSGNIQCAAGTLPKLTTACLNAFI
jgi:hypothetical protein